MKRNITKKRERNKTQEKTSDAQCNCSPPADRCPVSSRAAIRPARPTPPCLYTGHDVPWYGIPLWLVWVSCPYCVPSQLLVHSQPLLAGQYEKLKSPRLCINPA